MTTPRLLALSCAATLALAATSASAQSASVSVGVTAETGARTAQRDVRDRTCLRHTGTRIHNRARVTVSETDADANAKSAAALDRRRDCGLGPGRAYSRDDIEMTGRTNVADALRVLDPSIR